jgi:putative ABC transport system ATP-binding protein
VSVGGHDLHDLDGDALAAYRRATVGFVFPHFGLLETLTAAENVELALALALALAGTRPAARRRRARDLLAAVGLADRALAAAAGTAGGEGLVAADGFHPSTEGHRRVAAAFAAAVAALPSAAELAGG